MRGERGLTLLEVLIATVIMAIAVVGLLTNLTTSMRNASRLSDYDRATMLARAKMDELLTQYRLPRNQILQGDFDRAITGQTEAGWRARVTPFEAPSPNPPAGTQVLNRVELEVWWKHGEDERKTLLLEAFRRDTVLPEEVAP